MPSGRLAAVDIPAATNYSLYPVPAGKLATFSVSFCNRTAQTALVRLALAATATPTAAEWVMYDILIDGNGVIERTGLILDAAKIAVVYVNNAGVSGVVYVFEE